MNTHSFDVSMAENYGLNAALIFKSIAYWVDHNQTKPDRVKDGMSWVYMSRKAWAKEYPYLGEGAIRSALDTLLEKGLVKTGNYSGGMYKRTTWYTLTEKGWNLWLNKPNPLAKITKPFGENNQTITDTNITDTNKQITPLTPQEGDSGFENNLILESFERFWSVWPRSNHKVNKKACFQKWKARKLYEKEAEIMHCLNLWKLTENWNKQNGDFIPQPATWLNQNRWEVDVQISRDVLIDKAVEEKMIEIDF